MTTRNRNLVAAFVVVTALVGCSSVSVKKVPIPSDYADGKDATAQKTRAEIRKKADSMEGFRYYLPRPYVAVKQRYPIDIQSFVLTGKVENGVFKSGTTGKQAVGLLGKMGVDASLAGSEIQIPWSQLTQSSGGTSAQAAGGGGDAGKGAGDGGAGGAGKGDADGGDGGAGKGDAETPDPKKGDGDADKAPAADQGADKEKETNAGLAGMSGGKAQFSSLIPENIKPSLVVSSFYDIIYLPDFNEQYVVKTKGRLGHAQAQLGLRYGWMLENGSESEDNTEIARFIFTEIHEFAELARKAIELKISPESLLAGKASGASAPQSMASTLAVDADEKTGHEVFNATVKLTVVRFANVGIHPVLKPWEYEDEAARVAVGAPGRAAQSTDVLVHNFPVRYSYSTELYAEPLGPRPAPEPPKQDDTSKKGEK